MDTDLMKGRWKEIRGEIQRRWSELTGDDLERIAGDRTKLIAALQQRYAQEHKQVAEEVDRFFDDLAARIARK